MPEAGLCRALDFVIAIWEVQAAWHGVATCLCMFHFFHSPHTMVAQVQVAR